MTMISTMLDFRRRPASVANVLLLAGAALSAACGTKDAAAPFEPTGPTGRVRFVNVITDTTRGRVNAILEGVPFGVNLTYATSTPAALPAPNTALYSPIYAGNRTLVLKRTADTNTVVATIAFAVAASQDQTVYAAGGAAASTIANFVTTDDNTLSATQARVRVVHLSPTAGAVDIFVTAPNADLATATPTLANVAVRTASAYLAVPAGTYQVRVVPAGTAAAARAGAVAINVASLALTANTVRTIVAADNNIGGAPLRAFVLIDR
ncbi:DUF4397 domain-containing protein [Gemmatimonas sp.]|uniref:DUF4397 domain-containing protein n=1 Tax=Gemmatimonas sp. TaxID=1962908 RepID=UPI0039837AF8